jgi:hypothetical protein
MQTLVSEIGDVKDEPATVCFVCSAAIPETELYCQNCINSGRRRCFVCRREYKSFYDHLECYRCRAPLTAHELRFVHRDAGGSGRHRANSSCNSGALLTSCSTLNVSLRSIRSKPITCCWGSSTKRLPACWPMKSPLRHSRRGIDGTEPRRGTPGAA